MTNDVTDNKKSDNSHELRIFYEEAVRLSKKGVLTAVMLKDKLGISMYGANCILYMLQAEEYCPELENIYTQDECGFLKGKEEGKYRMVKFFEDMPPFKHHQTYHHGNISDSDMERYVSLGLAKWVSFEEHRLNLIHIYVSFRRIIQQHNADMREALAHRNKEFYEEYFKEKDKDAIIESLKRDKFSDIEIKVVLNLLAMDVA